MRCSTGLTISSPQTVCDQGQPPEWKLTATDAMHVIAGVQLITRPNVAQVLEPVAPLPVAWEEEEEEDEDFVDDEDDVELDDDEDDDLFDDDEEVEEEEEELEEE